MKLKLLASLITSLAIAGVSYGLTWTDSYGYSQNGFGNNAIADLDGSPNSSSGTFVITDNGFVDATMNVTSAVATFWFADDESDGAETVNFLINGTVGTLPSAAAWTNVEVNGAHPGVGQSYWNTFASYSVTLNASQIAALQDGTVSWTVNLASGDTYLKIVQLTVQGSSNTVPDAGATAALMGLGFLGLVAARKRFGK
jgi:hypothetical protein